MEPRQETAEKKSFLNHIHYFRAFAILNIVIVHVWHIPRIYIESQYASYTLINVLREVMFHESTIYFIFISGFLFYYLSPKFNIQRYYKSKFTNVISPYIFMTLFALIIHLNDFIRPEDSLLLSFKKILNVFIYGKAQVQYWYIPFISLVFIISPFILKIPKPILSKIILFACFLPLLGTRTGTTVSVGQYIYFFPIYLLGIYIAMDYANFISKIETKKTLLVTTTILSTGVLLYIHWKNYQFSFSNITESVFYIQKISLSFLILIALKKLEYKKIPILNSFATYSFAVYFTHLLVGNRWVHKYYYTIVSKSSFLIIPASIVYVVTITFATLFICMSLKKLLGKQSRYFIGV
ncbi:MAG: acyltransferase [Proteobacteria bacterium]|nr:acyltransferase [Pseudomonadota bacterium]MBU1058252.1 acyltransferase [Pseudomonadota bacterium]